MLGGDGNTSGMGKWSKVEGVWWREVVRKGKDLRIYQMTAIIQNYNLGIEEIESFE